MNMDIDKLKKSEAYTTAIKALQKLLEVDENAVDIAYSETVREKEKQYFIQSYKLKESKGRICIHRLTGKKCTHNLVDCIPPGSDHSHLWLKNGKPYMFTSQPYSLEHKELVMLIDYCNKNGLHLHITGMKQWHCPGKVFTVMITAK